MLPLRSPQNGSRNQPRTSSSRPTKPISKPRCETWIPLRGWEQNDEAESDIFYLAIDAWAKRNSQIKADAPKGVPSSRIWEPFLCTTKHQCTGIVDFEAFVNASLRLHKDIDDEDENEEKTHVKDTNRTTTRETNGDGGNNAKIPQDKTQDEQPKNENDRLEKSTNGHLEGRGKDVFDKKDKGTNDLLDNRTNNNSTTKGQLDERTNAHSDKIGNDNSNKRDRIQTSKKDVDCSEKRNGQSANQYQTDKDSSEIHDRLSPGSPPKGGGDGDTDGKLDDEDILEWMTRNGTSHSAPVSRTQQREPTKRRGRSAKANSAEDRLRRAALRNATKTKVNSKKVTVPVNPVKISYAHSGNPRTGIFAGGLPMNAEPMDNSDHGGVSEDTPGESTTDEAAARVSLDHRLLIEEVIKESKKIEYMPKTSVVSIGDLLSSAPRLERRQGQQHSNGRDAMYAAIANEENRSTSRESFVTSSSQGPSEVDIRSPSSSSLPPVPVTNKSSIPTREVHSSNSPRSEGRRPGPRQTVNLNSAKIPVISYRKAARRDTADNGESDQTKPDRKLDIDDPRLIKYNDSIMSAIQETTVELDNDVTNRGPPAFRPQSFKTPLQRAVENAHKKMYGQHYYLFNNNNSGTAPENMEDTRHGAENGRILRTQSANGEPTNAYVWKENIESQQRHRRKAYSGSEKSRSRPSNGHQGSGAYNVSDFKPNFRKDTLKTERRKPIQR